jgi:uncharacterized protein with ATP-grasp and redox domains
MFGIEAEVFDVVLYIADGTGESTIDQVWLATFNNRAEACVYKLRREKELAVC